MQILSSIKELIQKRSEHTSSQKIGFVPTMGFLHEGHLSMVKKARAENDIVIVSIFVNPTQFGPKEDLSSYPRDLKKDLALLEKFDVDIVFTPTADEMYPQGYSTYVEPTGLLVTEAEGALRRGHFRGVATILLKLFTITTPNNVYFGQKDAQQVAVVSQMIKDFNLRIKLCAMPTIRAKDSLAMSSRNSYLSTEERKLASILYKTLLTGKNASQKTKHTADIIKIMHDEIAKEKQIELEYIQIRHAETFAELKTLTSPAVILIAARIGTTRLIDNILFEKDGSWNTGIIV